MLSNYKKYIDFVDSLDFSSHSYEEQEDKIKGFVYKQHIKRLLFSLQMLEKVEERMLKDLENQETEFNLKELIELQKTITKTIDLIKTSIIDFEPSIRKANIVDITKELGLSSTDNPKQILKKIISSQLITLLSQVHETQENLLKHRQGTIGNWKASESLKSLTEVIDRFIKMLDGLEEDEKSEINGITVKDIVELYNQFLGDTSANH